MALLKFNKGLFASLPATQTEGSVYITTDTKEMYVDVAADKRIAISKIVVADSVDANGILTVDGSRILKYSNNLLYYVKGEDNLRRCAATEITEETTSVNWTKIGDLTELTNALSSLGVRLIAVEKEIYGEGEGDAHTPGLKENFQDLKTAVSGINASTVETTQDIVVTAAVGNYPKGKVVKIDDIQEIIKNMLSTDIPPSVTQPSASLTLKNAKGYEVGYTFTPNYEFSTSAGTYSNYRNPETGKDVAQATGVTFGTYSVTETGRPDGKTADTKTTKIGSFESFVVTDSTNYKLTSASCVSSDGIIPKSYLGVDDDSKQIKEITHTLTDSAAVTGIRYCFYGTLTEKSNLTSAIIRGLAKKVESPKKGTSFNMDIPVGALRAIIAYPADATNLSDITELSSVKDANASDAQIASAFTYIGTMDVNGYNNNETYKKSYKIFQKDWSSAVDTKNTYKVVL